MKFILQKISDEGTSEPFIARMMMQNLELRDSILHDKQVKRQFDEFYEPILNNLRECKTAKNKCEKLIHEHELKIISGNIVSFQKHAFNIHESIDTDLNQNFKDFFIKGEIALQSLSRLSKFMDYPISFFFQEDDKFEKGKQKFLAKHAGNKFEEFVKILCDDRSKWYLQFNAIRNRIEHEGLNLPRINYKIDEINKKVNAFFPTLNHQSLIEVFNLFWGKFIRVLRRCCCFLAEF